MDDGEVDAMTRLDRGVHRASGPRQYVVDR